MKPPLQTSLRPGICGWVIPALPKVPSQLLLDEGTHPKPLCNQRSTSHLYFPRMNLGSSPLQEVPGVGMGCRSQPEHRSRNKPLPYSELLPFWVCKLPQTSNFLPLSHLLLSLHSSHPLTFFAVQRSKHERGKSASKFKDKLQTGQESQPIYYPSAASDAAFPPPETNGVFFSLICLFFRNFQMPA